MDNMKNLIMKMKIEQIDDYNCLVNDVIIKLHSLGGCRRKGFYENYIIKFDETDIIFEDEESQNEREIFLWKIMDKKDRKYFPKMKKYSQTDGYIVQERIRFQRGRKAFAHQEIIRELIKKYSIEDISFNGINENWGVRDNGIPVIYDYGLFINS